jgi:hypothetical protein
MPKLTKEFWNSKSEIIEAAVKGWNPLMRLPVLLKEAYPDLKIVDFGFCSDSDMPEWMSQGWIPMSPDHFEIDEFNKSDIPARFGLRDVGGVIKWRDNTLMVMGKDFRDDLKAARNRHSEDKFQASITDKAYTAPQDPRKEEMEKFAESKVESSRLQPTPDSPRPKRGRPPKKK